MRTIVSGQHAANSLEFAELALGIDNELFTGPASGESDTERAARLDAARGILDDLRHEDPELAAYAARLLDSASLRQTVYLISAVPRSGKTWSAATPWSGWAA
ncbi:hypothetical protein [Streptacidiphilus monticola]|uniref:Uncharacterized protein n=1 Tax=Streptacidiphilus monticola TaxID=2161674 RepID=A0ABW1G5N9_9ACTN